MEIHGGFGSSRRIGRAMDTTPRAPSPPIGPILRTISLNRVTRSIAKDRPAEAVRITNCECIGSYNWVDSVDPRIVIPGCPPRWTPPSSTTKLPQDRGEYYRDPNAAHFPTHPLEPAVRTYLAGSSHDSPQDLDVFACASTLGSLLRYVRKVDKPFRFFVEAIGPTVFFTRHEGSPKALIPNVVGYGHTFPDAYTTWEHDVKGSVSHQRLLRYNLGDLTCVVRHECDGYLDTHSEMDTTVSKKTKSGVNEDVSDLLSSLNVASRLGTSKQPLQIDYAGHRVAQARVFDLKTRAAWKPNTVMEEEMPRFWVSQIPNFILARHEKGVFNDIEVVDVSRKVEQWQSSNQQELRQLVYVLREIINAVKARVDKKLEVRCKCVGVLELREQNDDSHNTLPPQLQAIWDEDQADRRENVGSESVLRGAQLFHSCDLSTAQEERCRAVDPVNSAGLDFTACSAECSYCGRCSQ